MKTTKIKDFITKIKTPLFQFIHLALAVILLAFLLYLRFLPRTARDLWETLNTWRFLVLLFTIILIILNMYNSAKMLGWLPKSGAILRIEKIKIRLAQYYSQFLDIFKNFYDFCWYILEYFARKFFKYECLHYNVIRRLTKSFNNPKHFPYYFAVLMGIKFIPRIIFVGVFFVEAIFYHHLDLTFKCIPFLLILFLEDIFLFIIEDFHSQHFKGLRSFVIEVKGIDFVEYEYNPTARDQYPYGTKSDEDFMVNHFINALIIPQTLDKYSAWKNYLELSNRLLLFLQCIRLITYLFMLFFAIISMGIF